MLIYLILSFSLFIIGFIGMFLVRKHIIMILISFELILLAVNINFLVNSIYFDDLMGHCLLF
jgi:NADH-quinone oxidoreductase subunit K